VSPEQQKYIDDMRDLFVMEGWKWVETDCQNLINLYSDIDGITTEKELSFAKGVLFCARSIIRLPDQIAEAEEYDEDN